MPIISFPAAPNVNDTYSFNGKTWIYNGEAWIISAQTSINNIPIGNVAPASGNFTIVGATGNITTSGYFIGNGSQLTGIGGKSTTVSNVAPASPAAGDVWIGANTGIQYIYFESGGNSQWAEMEEETGIDITIGDVDLLSVSNNIIPTANITYDIGTTSNRFRDIYLANSTIYLGSATISSTAANVLLPANVAFGNATIAESGGVLALPADVTIGGSSPEVPKISNVQITDSSYTPIDDTAIDVNGGYFIVNGSGFLSGATVLAEDTAASSTTFVNSTLLRCQVGSKTAATYNLYVVNPDGGTAIKPAGLTFSSFPAWVTGSTLANATANVAFSYTLTANGATSYALAAGNSVPNGSALYSNGQFSGNVAINSNTAYSFTVVATDAEAQDSLRTFSLTIVYISKPETVQYLVVAGGGGGGGGRSGNWEAGGGGAGGYLANVANVTVGTTYSVVVGAGGGGGAGGPTPGGGSQGGTSSAFGTSTTGGGAGTNASAAAGSGGSGGGSYAGAAGSGTPGQGNPGGTGGGYGQNGAGGGGAGQAGSPGPISVGRGGNGNVWLNGTTYAGGGGGQSGIGGSGGGSPGKAYAPGPAAGTTNTGGGGGAGWSSSSQPGGTGGSGVVILRYESYLDPAANTNGTVSVTTANGYRYYTFTSSGNITW